MSRVMKFTKVYYESESLIEQIQRLRVERDAARDIAVMLEQENAQLEKQARLMQAKGVRLAADLIAERFGTDKFDKALNELAWSISDSAVIKGDSPYNDTSRTGELA